MKMQVIFQVFRTAVRVSDIVLIFWAISLPLKLREWKLLMLNRANCQVRSFPKPLALLKRLLRMPRKCSLKCRWSKLPSRRSKLKSSSPQLLLSQKELLNLIKSNQMPSLKLMKLKMRLLKPLFKVLKSNNLLPPNKYHRLNSSSSNLHLKSSNRRKNCQLLSSKQRSKVKVVQRQSLKLNY